MGQGKREGDRDRNQEREYPYWGREESSQERINRSDIKVQEATRQLEGVGVLVKKIGPEERAGEKKMGIGQGEKAGGEKSIEKNVEEKEKVSAAGQAGERGKPRILPPGWEWIWAENPWMRRWERLMVPREEVARRRRNTDREKASYWGEMDSQEWRSKIREEKSRVEREKRERAQMDDYPQVGEVERSDAWEPFSLDQAGPGGENMQRNRCPCYQLHQGHRWLTLTSKVRRRVGTVWSLCVEGLNPVLYPVGTRRDVKCYIGLKQFLRVGRKKCPK